MSKPKTSAAFRLLKGCVKMFYPRIQAEGTENLPDEPVIIVANHCQMNGPIVGELYVPTQPYIWCAAQMMHLKEVPQYAFQDFWGHKPKWARPFYKLLSYLIAPLSVCIFNNARTIGVYHDARLLSTFRSTLKKLQEGKNVVVFPEQDVPYNHVVYAFQDKFIEIAKMYHKKTGKQLQFVPMYIAPKLKKLCFGKPIPYCPEEPMERQRSQICAELMEAITALAESLPLHTVVPYRNVSQKEYPTNIPEEHAYEKTRS